MAASVPGPDESGFIPSQHKLATPQNYVDLDTLLDLSKTDYPDIYEQLTPTFGDQSLMDFCKTIGAYKPLAANVAEWFEETRLHNDVAGVTVGTTTDGGSETLIITVTTAADLNIRLWDKVTDGVQEALVVAVDSGNLNVTLQPYVGWKTIYGAAAPVTLVITGNEYEPGTQQPAEFIESGVRLLTSPAMIMKENYKVTGSQATNRSWIKIPSNYPGGGGYLWYMKGEADQRKRFNNYRTISMITGEVKIAAGGITQNVKGTEGIMAAVKSRGINVSGEITALADVDAIILEWAKIRADKEQTAWMQTSQKLSIDDLLATAAGAGINASFGMFQNGKEDALNLGFSSYERGGYTTHYRQWDLLDDPTLLGAYPDLMKALYIPGMKRFESKSNSMVNAFTVRYKDFGGYNRDMEHWVLGSALQAKTDGNDWTSFEYRSEIAAQVFGATRYTIVTG